MSSVGDRHPNDGGLVFRPSKELLLHRVSPWLFLGLAVIYLYPGYRKLTEWWPINPLAAIGLIALSGGVLLALIVVAIRVSRRATELVVEPDRIIYKSLVRTRSWARAELARLVHGGVLVQLLQSPSYSSEQLMFINRSGHCFLRLGPEWQQVPIGYALGIAPEPIGPNVVTAGDAAKAYPGSYGWLTAHPWGRYFVAIASGFVLFAIFVVLVSVFGGGH